MKIDKKLTKNLLKFQEFGLTELEYKDGQTSIKVSKVSRISEQGKASAVSPNKAVLNTSSNTEEGSE